MWIIRKSDIRWSSSMMLAVVCVIGGGAVPQSSLRGAALTGTGPAAEKTVACVSAASYGGGALAPDSIVAAFGAGLAASTQVATSLPLPTSMAGTRVVVKDSAGVQRPASLFFVSPSQINFQMPEGSLAGPALITVSTADGSAATGTVQIAAVAPGLFSANSSGKDVAAGYAVRVRNGAQSLELIARYDQVLGRMLPVMLDLGPATDDVYLVLFGTGFRHQSSLAAVSVKVGGIDAQVLYAGPVSGFVGLDQLNLRVPRGVAGCHLFDVVLAVEGRAANTVQVSLKNGNCPKV